MTEGSGRLFCFGLGYSATVLARRLLAEGWTVAGTCQGAERAAELSGLGITAHPFDGGRPLDGFAAALAGCTHLLSSVPPGKDGDPVLAAHGGDLAGLSGPALGRLPVDHRRLRRYRRRPGRRIGPPQPRLGAQPPPRRGRGRLDGAAPRPRPAGSRLPAGRHLRPRAQRPRPGAGRRRPACRQARPRLRPHPCRRHRLGADGVHGPNPAPGAVYNVCDDEPAAPAEVVEFACRLLGIAPPPEIPFDEAAKDDVADGAFLLAATTAASTMAECGANSA